MIHRVHHLQEERLFECYLAERSGTPIDLPAAEHLADCESCAARYADLAAFMEAVRAGGESEADALFTPERLRAQGKQVARRIEHIGRPARVLGFPGRVVRRTMTASARTAPRWIAAGAAAGLFVGIALGASYQYGSYSRQTQRILEREAGPAARLTPVATRGSGQPQVAADTASLSDLELALERPHTRELVAFDAFTPHVRDIH